MNIVAPTVLPIGRPVGRSPNLLLSTSDLSSWGVLRCSVALANDPAGAGGQVTKITVTANTSVALSNSGIHTAGVLHHYRFELYVPSTNSDVTGVRLADGFNVTGLDIAAEGATQDVWQPVFTFGTPAEADLRFVPDTAADGNINAVAVAGIGDVFYLRNIQILEYV